MKKISLLLTLQFLSMFCFSQLNTNAIDSIFSDWNTSNSPGCAIGIFKEGEIVYSKGYGSANLEYSIPISPVSVFRIGSTSKQFTAACIVLLEQQGKLKFENTLAEYFPEFPSYAKKITVRHLLNHTSGLRDYLALSYLKGLSDDDFYTNEDVMQWMINQSGLNFEPGSEYVYCNSGYWLLGQIVKEVTGHSMAEFADQEIFKPLGMQNTHFHNDHTAIVSNRASGYEPETDSTFSISMTTLDMIGDGGIFTTIEDIKHWDDAFYASTVLNSDFWTEMTRKGVLNSGDTINYASGLMIATYKGLRAIRHDGAFVGFKAELLRFPEQQITIAIFANRADANPASAANAIADIILADVLTNRNIPKKLELIDEDELKQKKFVGDYEMRPGRILTIGIVKDSLQLLRSWNGQKSTLERAIGNTFVIPGNDKLSLRFVNIEDGFAQSIDVNFNGRIIQSRRKEFYDVSTIKYEDYTGVYFSEDLEVEYSITFENDTLLLSINQNEATILTPDNASRFYSKRRELNFFRDKETITGFMLNAGRAKNFPFMKK